MLVPWRRFQGIAVVAILILVMIGGCLPDPFVTQTSPSQARPAKKGMIAEIVRLFDSSKSYFDHNMNYAASAPLLRSLIKYELGASSSPQVYIGHNYHLFYSGSLPRPSRPAPSTGDLKHFTSLKCAQSCAASLRAGVPS